MKNFITREDPLFLYLTIEAKEQDKLDRFLSLLGKSGVYDLLHLKTEEELKKGGRPPYSQADLLATIIYGFSSGKSSVRDLEEACKFDLRFIYLMRQATPTYKIFANFINEYIVPNKDLIFSLVTKAIADECDFKDDELFIDGTKIEADANKYKFVWKPTTWHKNLCSKVRKLLSLINLSRGVPEDDIFSSKIIVDKIDEYKKYIDSLTDKKEIKIANSRLNNLCDYLLKAIEYEEKERICGPNRNSYYKTDHDATAMCLKEDYYSGLGSSMHAGYNTQIAVSEGLIVAYFVSQSRNDINDFIPVLNKYHDFYNKYPETVCADAGYGSFDNYKFMKDNNIKSYVKFQSWSGNVDGSRPDSYVLQEDESIKCLNSNIGIEVQLDNRHPTKANTVFYKIEGCNSCPFKDYCKRYMNNKDEDFKIFEVNKEYQILKNETIENLLSIKGIEMRVNRSIQVEGAFGIIKQDMNYTRSRRTSLSKVEAEFMLTYLGFNIRKLFRFYEGKLKKEFWSAPENTTPETFKKPSAKRLSNKANKKKNKSVNEQLKSDYRRNKRASE